MAKGNKYDGGNSGQGGDFALLDVKSIDMKTIRYTEDGTFALDIMPYKIKSKNHPRVARGESDVGDEEFILVLDVHRNIGPKHSNIICPENFNKSCPICNHLADVNNEFGWKSKEGQDAYKKCGKSTKAFYYAVDPDSKDKKIQLFETSWKNFQKELDEEARSEGKRKGITIVPFADFPNGSTVEFRVTMETFGAGSKPFPKFKAFKFIPRKGNEYPTDLLDDLPGLEELMILKSEDEIEALINGADDDGDQEDEAPRGRSREVEEEPVRARRGADREEEAPAEEEEAAPTKCPVKGGTFGVDIDDLTECDSCSLRSACSAEYKAKRRRGA
jgi:hypothetical protein